MGYYYKSIKWWVGSSILSDWVEHGRTPQNSVVKKKWAIHNTYVDDFQMGFQKKYARLGMVYGKPHVFV